MILGAPCAHRAPGVGDFPWGPRRLVAVPVAPPAPRRRPVRPEVVARGRSRESRRSASLSCRRQLLLRAAERPARPWSLSLSPPLVVLCQKQPPPTVLPVSARVAHAAQARPPPPHTHVCRRRPRDAAATRGTTLTARLCPRRRPAARGRVGVPRGNGGHVLAAVGRAAVGLRRQRGAHVRAWAWVRGWTPEGTCRALGRGAGGGTQAPLPPAVVSAAVRTPTKTSEWGA